MIRFLHRGTSVQILRPNVSRSIEQQCGKVPLLYAIRSILPIQIKHAAPHSVENIGKKKNVSVILIKSIKSNWIARNAPIVWSQLQLSVRNYKNDRTDPVSENDSMIFINNCTVYIWACVNFAWNYMKAIYFWTDNRNFNKRAYNPRLLPTDAL